jgi:hypothetical protein
MIGCRASSHVTQKVVTPLDLGEQFQSIFFTMLDMDLGLLDETLPAYAPVLFFNDVYHQNSDVLLGLRSCLAAAQNKSMTKMAPEIAVVASSLTPMTVQLCWQASFLVFPSFLSTRPLHSASHFL